MTQTVPPGAVPGFDRILAFEPGVRAVAVRNVPGTLPIFTTHFPRRPVYPGALLLENMAELAAAVAGAGAWRLSAVIGVRFRHFVAPGDQVEITAEAAGAPAGPDGAVTTFQASARVEGRTVADVRELVLRDDTAASPGATGPHTAGTGTISEPKGRTA
ncbi:3-hydroxyacyl-ACP dehydratase FabZ family protein [Actinomadura sp. NEAU-AAG7]|uniref:3-hydroxyacyl-ACP dehydratase FabZ family protein n=1 Tax=Actinomadura sp. NEAU-AAG7 TaxID=2839640 RepID=UPI001BE4D3F6|nr:hypothetical protein [Actinomadura sp. NEAU-AAG7]MBT2212399.1 hypothetical protein [Actinomadura sp. NEAU-AAG7]